MNDLQVFQNCEFGELKVLEQNGKPYFPATACAKALGYKRPADAITAHCKGSVKYRVPTNGGDQELKFIPEGDLYRLIVHSKLPSAERFEKWVFDEVLPSIRRTGSYGQPDIAAIVAQTANTVCTEMIRQLVPLLQSITAPAEPEADSSAETTATGSSPITTNGTEETATAWPVFRQLLRRKRSPRILAHVFSSDIRQRPPPRAPTPRNERSA